VRDGVRVVDSHTAGEPTRVVVAGGPDLGPGPLARRRAVFAERWDGFRRGVVCEPRGSDVLVGALLCAPAAPGCAAGAIFFNNVGCLGMCGHGTMGLVATLAHLGRIVPGRHRIDTPVGVVTAELAADGRVTVENVPSRRHAKDVPLTVPGHGRISGDVAWGGNWFFLTRDHGQELRRERVAALSGFARAVREALERAGVRGEGGAPVDHVELLGPGGCGADARNFVLCPGGAYDRSPCGTGTSAELACLAADGRLAPGRRWVQEGILGTRFEASYAPGPDGAVVPSVTGAAFITAEALLLFDARDPFRDGL
jgi:4-hydroxyproline epimerase